MTDEKDLNSDEEFVPEDGDPSRLAYEAEVEGNTATQKDVVKDLREKLAKALAEKQEYLDGWQRAKADFVNARKRDEEAKKEMLAFAGEDILAQIIPVLDSFTMAFANKEVWEKVDQNWRLGVEHIYSQLKGILEQNGLKEFDPKGEKFDPMSHHAIESISVNDPAQDHIILEVVQKGYNLNGKIVRPASVKIGTTTPNVRA